ncbi:proline-rich protein 18 [Heptranchias perlo]|uniref:proline-rich protein 18 n=1 Tax=Heptranchias perlo TaxID=212740 RepID=UPI003559D5FC
MKTDAPPRPHRAAVPFPPIRQPAAPPPQPPGLPTRSRGAAEKFSNSWPKANFQLGGHRPQPRHQQHQRAAGAGRLLGPRPLASSCDSVPASTSGHSAKKSSGEEVRFSLSLTPEAVLVIQKRSLERQLLSQGKTPAPAPAAAPAPLRCKKLLTYPARPPHPGAVPPLPRSDSPADIRSLVKISLLNDQHKYDDVEYEEEEEDEPPDQSVLQKCMEWLKGVESARQTADRLASLPHLAS